MQHIPCLLWLQLPPYPSVMGQGWPFPMDDRPQFLSTAPFSFLTDSVQITDLKHTSPSKTIVTEFILVMGKGLFLLASRKQSKRESNPTLPKETIPFVTNNLNITITRFKGFPSSLKVKVEKTEYNSKKKKKKILGQIYLLPNEWNYPGIDLAPVSSLDWPYSKPVFWDFLAFQDGLFSSACSINKLPCHHTRCIFYDRTLVKQIAAEFCYVIRVLYRLIDFWREDML